MVKSEWVRVLSDKLPELQIKDVVLAVDCIFEHMKTALENGERIEIRGFGSFDLRHQSARLSRNPKTGESVNLAAKVRLHFKPGKELRDRVDAARNKCRITE
ncbi:MAG: integration host factor subunit beta [Methylococcaceae bacterium]